MIAHLTPRCVVIQTENDDGVRRVSIFISGRAQETRRRVESGFAVYHYIRPRSHRIGTNGCGMETREPNSAERAGINNLLACLYAVGGGPKPPTRSINTTSFVKRAPRSTRKFRTSGCV